MNLPSELTVDDAVTGEKVSAVIEKIGDNAFFESKIEDIKLPSGVRRLGKDAFAFSQIKNIELPEGLQYIGECAFRFCQSLDSIKIPESVVYMDLGCFLGCDEMTVVDLPSTLKAMGGMTFTRCNQMQKIICRAEVPPTADDTDLGIFNNYNLPEPDNGMGPDDRCKLYVPRESIELYKNAPMWERFSNFTYAIEDLMSESEITAVPESVISCIVSDGEVRLSCQANDVVAVYDAEGVCLLNETIESPRVLTHKGEGIRIVCVNGQSVKVIL